MKNTLKLKLFAGVVALLLVGSAAADEVQRFAEAEIAANTLVVALAGHDSDALKSMLGEDYTNLLPPDTERKEMLSHFLHEWTVFHALTASAPDSRTLAVGESGWTLPIPIVKDAQGWYFDTAQAKELIRLRRIGNNELSTIQSVLAYHDAQVEYAQQDHDRDGSLEYAQRFLSTPETQDGLYWDAAAGEPQSPLGPLLAEQEPGKAYHGYFYRILTAQGDYAPGGAESYVQNGNMTGGFGILAWPASYGDSGVMSFMMGPNGTVYEADLGADTADAVAKIDTFDPDLRWTPTLDDLTAPTAMR